MITTHYMKLNVVPFKQMKNGSKTIEIRCNDEKRQLIINKTAIEFYKSLGMTVQHSIMEQKLDYK